MSGLAPDMRHHLAILRKSSGLLEKITSGEKKIESRWYSTRRAPWGRIKEGDIVFFKYSGGAVEASAKAAKVLQFSDLTVDKIENIWAKYGNQIGLEAERIPAFLKSIGEKRYCILVFLKDVKRIQKFKIDKTGYGNASAWIVVDNIELLRSD